MPGAKVIDLMEALRASLAQRNEAERHDWDHDLRRVEGWGQEQCAGCRAVGAELPSECPGVPMTPEQRVDVFEGRLDYVKGSWVVS